MSASDRKRVTIDGNEAAASVAYRLSEVIAIYPITPASPMGELSDEWAAGGRPNVWGVVPEIVEMQSEGGAAGAVHGALQAGALTTTFTASQGLLLMLPNMYKIAGELTATCLHVAARSVATHALSIFGDHSDVMACRQSGFAMLCSGSVQEAHDLACIGHAASLESRVPFLHFFDGFRTSHEMAKIDPLSDEDLRAMVRDEWIARHRERALTPDRPVLRGTAQNPDVFFQAREAANPYHRDAPALVQATMDRFFEVTGRRHRLFDYSGHPEAERVIVMMGSGAETAHETVDWMVERGERVGLVRVRLFRPFSAADFVRVLPASVRHLAVLDRTKEPGSVGEPLYLDVVAALHEEAEAALPCRPDVQGGRYGLSSKEFAPSCVKAVFDALADEGSPRHFTVGITDDVTHASLPVDESFEVEAEDSVRAVFYGLGADGTVSANKSSIKIIGEETDHEAQAYFVYDSKKAGARTVSHLRFGPRPIRSTSLVRRASFVACHQWTLLDEIDVLAAAEPGATFLLNAPHPPDRAWDRLPREVQEAIVEKGLRFWIIDARAVAREAGLGRRINTVMQACFFALSGVLPRDEAIARIKDSIATTYGRKGADLVRRNREAVDRALEHLHEIEVPAEATSTRRRPPAVPAEAPDFVQRVTRVILEGHGDRLPVSAFPVDGTWPLGTSRWEKRNLAHDVPVWDEELCIQCNKCALVCPHAAIRTKVYPPDAAGAAPPTFKSVDWRGPGFEGQRYTVQVAPEDCTGCGLCIAMCPAKDKANPRRVALESAPLAPLRDAERENYEHFLAIPEADRSRVRLDGKGSQLLQPLFEYSGACAGCGETPYLKLLTQLFGDRLLVANATGCSSIYGGNLPTTPYTTNEDGRGPAWSNSLFEDNAEFGFGMRLAVDALAEQARGLLRGLRDPVGADLADALLGAGRDGEAGLAAQRARVATLRDRLGRCEGEDARRLTGLADWLVRKSVWIVGGDGWAYDIGYGGLDHVLSQRRDVNLLVLDTEVYSNTGGQQSKATPLGAAAKFASAGKDVPKKDLGLEAMSFGHVYVASVAWGAKDRQTVRAMVEAESYDGPSLILAHCPCIAHGYDLARGGKQQALAVDSGAWPLYRFDPRRMEEGLPPLVLDSGAPKVRLHEYLRGEARFMMVQRRDPQRFRRLVEAAQESVRRRRAVYEQLAGITVPTGDRRPGDAE